MPGTHLARHLSSTPASAKKKAAAKRKRKAKVARKAKRAGAKRLGRPKGVAARLGLRDMTSEQLTDVIAAARAEAQRKLRELEASLN